MNAHPGNDPRKKTRGSVSGVLKHRLLEKGELLLHVSTHESTEEQAYKAARCNDDV
jgi:hypothetical protein